MLPLVLEAQFTLKSQGDQYMMHIGPINIFVQLEFKQ